MDRICKAAESAIDYGQDISASTAWGRGDRYDALTHAACELAEVLDVDAILTSTQSGLSCVRISRFRPPNRILAVSPEEETVRRLALVWGVTAMSGEQAGSFEERFREAVEAAEHNEELKEGDRIILTGGIMSSTLGVMLGELEQRLVEDPRLSLDLPAPFFVPVGENHRRELI